MADQFVPLPVKTKTDGDISVKIDQTTPGTTNAVQVVTALPAGANLIGKVKLRNPGDTVDLGDSTNPVRVDPTGTTTQPVSGTVAVSGTVSVSVDPPTSPQYSTLTSASLAAGASVDLNATEITNGTTGKLVQVSVASTVPLKIEIKTVKNAVVATRVVRFTSAAHPSEDFVPSHKNFITILSVVAQTDNFRVTVTNMDNALAADVYATVLWDEV